MPKIVLADLTSLSNQSSAIETINENMAAIVEAFDNTLSLDGTTPNSMSADLDMDENKVINVADPVSGLDAVNLRSVEGLVDVAIEERITEVSESTITTIVNVELDADTRFLRKTGGVMKAVGATNGIEITPDSEGSLEIAPESTSQLVKIHADSASNNTGGIVFGRTILRIPIKDITSDGTETARGGTNIAAGTDGTWASAKLNISRATGVTVTIQDNNADSEDWHKGDYFTVCQIGTGQITVALEVGTLRIPADLLAATREQYSCITFTCDDPTPGAPVWTASGDLDAA